jgi:endonuclease G, mitochondrial
MVWGREHAPFPIAAAGVSSAYYPGASAAHCYQRGHRAPLASFKGADAARKLNYLANITPQTANLNAGPWARLEEAGRDKVRRWETV